MRVLLVEPDYRASYPPIGLLRIGSFHQQNGDSVTLSRGTDPKLRDSVWDRVYVSSLFTYELRRTVRTILYYQESVESARHLVVGGIAATLCPDFIKKRTKCKIVTGQLDRGNALGKGTPAISKIPPDYSLLDSIDFNYSLQDAFFCRATVGCIRQCKFCAVPTLESKYCEVKGWESQIDQTRQNHGERQHLVLLDNNILASRNLAGIISSIADQGFARGAKRNRRRRRVDVSQGLDARFITKQVARALGSINLHPIRLAFDDLSVETAYRSAIQNLAEQGFRKFNNYMLYNYNDTPQELYQRMRVGLKLGIEEGVEISGFPMRYISTDAIRRGSVGSGWTWRQLRGLQCLLLVTKGIVSPNPDFYHLAYGSTSDQFEEILSMPDRYILFRKKYMNNGAADWRRKYRKLTASDKTALLGILDKIHSSRDRSQVLQGNPRFAELLDHYYPNGENPPRK